MQDCYSDNAVFNDPVFGLLQGDEVKGDVGNALQKRKRFFIDLF